MNIKKKLQIVDILFKTLEKGEDITHEHVEQVLESMVQNITKRRLYKERMIAKYGADVFKKKAETMAKKVEEKGEDWRSERASKAAKSKKEEE